MYVKYILEEKYDLSSFNYENDFIVNLSVVDKVVHLNFGDRIVKFKFYEEELVDFDESIKNYLMAIRKEISNTTLIEIMESPLLKKLSSDTNDFYSESELKHYILFTMNYVMEIITFDEIHIN